MVIKLARALTTLVLTISHGCMKNQYDSICLLLYPHISYHNFTTRRLSDKTVFNPGDNNFALKKVPAHVSPLHD